MKVDLVIVNWNAGALLQKCVRSILAASNALVVKNIIIVDNNSSDSSLNILPNDSRIIYIKNKENFGFARACNQGFEIAKAEFILVLNPDTELLHNTLSDCIRFMESNPKIDVLGCTLLDEKKRVTKSCARFPVAYRYLFHSMGFTKLFPKYFLSPELMYDWDHAKSKYVDQVMGAFMFMRQEVFNKVGYFDERFFVYFEEMDFSYRLNLKGGKIYYNSEISAFHSGKGTTQSVQAYSLFLYLQSRLKYSRKHFSVFDHIIVLVSTLFFELLTRLFFCLVRLKIVTAVSILNAYRMLFMSFFKRVNFKKSFILT